MGMPRMLHEAAFEDEEITQQSLPAFKSCRQASSAIAVGLAREDWGSF